MSSSGASPSPGPHGSARRVAVVQRQARATLSLGAVFAVAAAIAFVVPHRTGPWLPLHLFLVGAMLLAISASTQLFAVTWAAGPPPSDRSAAMQRGLLAGGVAVMAAARELEWPTALLGAGGTSVLAALVILGCTLWRIVTRAVQQRFDATLRTYLAALVAGVAGCSLGLAMAVAPGAAVYERLRTAHLMLNLLGLIGLVIIGTLPFFAATQLRVKVSTRAGAHAQDRLLVWQASAVTVAAVGVLAESPALAAVGLGAYAAGLIRLATMLPGLGMKQLRWAGPRVLQLAAGLGWWIVITAVAAWQAARGRDVFPPAAVGVLVVGAYAQILAGSVAYLGPVLRGGGHERLTAGFRVTRSWIGLGTANFAAVAIALDWERLAVVVIGFWVLDTVVRAGLLRRRPLARTL